MSKKVAFIGLGVMGYPMAGHLAANGHDVTVYNRTASKAEQWAGEHTGQVAATPGEASQGAAYVMVCVGNDDDLRSVVYGDDGILAGAENGVLAIMCGGEADVFTHAEPVLQSYGKNVALMGDAGAGQLTKMVNQICIAGLVQALSEGIHFAETSGLDIEKVMGVVGGGAAQSWQLANRYQTMARDEFEFGFAVDWMRKDLSIVLDEARSNGASLPVTAMVDQYYADVQKMGGNRWDTSSLIARLRKFS